MLTTGSDYEAGVLTDTMYAAIPYEDPGTHIDNKHIIVISSVLTKRNK